MSSQTVRTIKMNDGREMPVVALGTWAPAEGTARQDAWKWILTSLKAGYRHIDTAHLYGTEKAVAKALKESGLNREDVYITTKLPFNHGVRVRESFNESLANLDTDYVDMYLIHWPQVLPYQESNELIKNSDGSHKTLDFPTFVEVWAEMEEILCEGKAKSIGVSNFSIQKAHPYLQQDDLREYCKQKGIVLSAFTPSGWDTVRQDPSIVELARKYNVSAHQVILAWHLTRDTVVVTKSGDPARQKENLKLPTLTEDDVVKINALDRGERLHKANDKGLWLGWTKEKLGW